MTDDPESKVRLAAFQQALRESGWAEGPNVRFDYRWGAGGADRIRSYRGRVGRARTGRDPCRYKRRRDDR